jgi:cytochrome P450
VSAPLLSQVPAPASPSIKILRGLPSALAQACFLRDPVGAIERAYRRYGPLVALGNVLPGRRERLRVLALGPRFNRAVLGHPELYYSTRLTVPGPAASAQARLSRGLTALNGEEHRAERRLVANLFSRAAVQAFQPEVGRIAGNHLAGWTAGRSFELLGEVEALVLRVAARFLFGAVRLGEGMELGRLLHRWMHSTWDLRVLLFPISLPGAPYRGVLRLAEVIESRILAELGEHRALLRQGGGALAAWAEARAQAPAARIDWTAGQVATLFLASFETATPSLVWTLFLLSQHPEVERALVEELDGTLRGAPPDSESLDRLPYLDAVLREALRVLPPVPYTLRRARAETDLEGLRLKKGDLVCISHYLTHHLPEVHARPLEFLPERWTGAAADSYEYLPFSAGPRACPGYFFATSVLKTVIVMVLQRFRLRVAPGARIDRRVEVSLRPHPGIPVTVHAPGSEPDPPRVRGNIHEMVTLASR